MREGLGLKGNDLVVFAFINGYSQGGHGCYYGSLDYLQDVCGISRRTAIDILGSLQEKGYIQKTDVFVFGGRRTGYSVSAEIAQMCADSAPAEVQKLHKSSAEIAPIYINNNKDNIGDKSPNIYSASKFQKPTLQEVADFCKERGNSVDPEAFIAHYESNGWMVGRNRMKNWRQAVITWEKSRKASAAPRKESAFERQLRTHDQMFGTNLHDQAYGQREVADEQ